jgi:hypothetical protein
MTIPLGRRAALGILASTAFAPVLAPSVFARGRAVATAHLPDVPYRYISGLEVLRLDHDRLRVSRGSCADNGGRGIIEIDDAVILDIRKIGPGGRDDVASPADAADPGPGLTPDASALNGFRPEHDGVPAPGWYHIVYLGDPQSSESAAILTRQISSMRLDRPGDARPPPNFSLRRHAPVAYYYDAKEGFRPQVCYGWPMPMCVYTSAGVKPQFAVTQNLSAPGWTVIQLSRFMPDTSRIIRLQAVVRGVSGGGAAYARTLPQRPGDVFLGRARGRDDVQTLIFEIASNSKETIAVKTEPGVTLSLYAVGFAMAQTY